MQETVWIDGSFVERADARMSAFDAAFQHGVGLFETMLAAGGRVFRLAEHMARIDRSARALGLTESLKTRALAETVEMVLGRSGLAEGDARARIRLTLTGGDLNMLARSGAGPASPTVMVAVQPATAYPDEMFERGVGIMVAEAKANPLNPFEGHKTVNYWWRLRALQQASGAGMGEALVLQVTNHICGGAVSNLFAVHDGTLVTPIARGEEAAGAVPSPVLPGITRAAVIELAGRMGIGCDTRMMAIDDVLDAGEVFLTNSGWGVLPVVRVEGKEIGSGLPGEITGKLRASWQAAVRDEP